MMSQDKVLPLSVQEARTMEISHDDWTFVGKRFNHPDTTQEALLELAKRTELSYAVRSQIADSIHCDEEVLEVLSSYTTDRWEWRAITNKYRELYSSYLEGLDEKAPFSPQMTAGTFEKEALASAFVLQTGPMFAEDLWHDLGTEGILNLDYQVDTIDGDRFGPLHDEKLSIDGTPEHYLLSPGYFCTWIERESDVDVDYVIEHVAESYAEEYLDNAEYQESDDLTEDSYAMLVGTSIGFVAGHLQVADPEKLSELLTDWASEFDQELVDQKVKITGAPEISGPRFRDLSEVEVGNMIDNLLIANRHFVMRNLGITKHLLSLVLLHEKTTQGQREKILESTENDADFSLVTSWLEGRE